MEDDQIRENILDTADRLFYSRGINSVGMDELRIASGVSLKAMYARFPSKASIILEVLDRRHGLWASGVNARAALADTARGKLLAIYDFLADWFADDSFRGCGFINAFAELGSVMPEVATRAREHKASFQAYVAGLTRDAGADSSLAPQLSILAEGAQTTAAIAGSAEAAGQARSAAVILIEYALSPAAKGSR